MKYVAAIYVVLALSMMSYGQQPSTASSASTCCKPEPEPKRAEVGNTSQAVDAGATVLVHLTMVELSLTKLQELGFHLPEILCSDAGIGRKPADFFVGNDDGKVEKVVEALCNDHLGRMLAQPILVTRNRTTSLVDIGGKLPLRRSKPDSPLPPAIEYGTRVEVTPEVLSDRIRLEVRCCVADLDYGHTTQVGGQSIPDVNTRVVDTAMELKNGQTAVLGGFKRVHMEAVNTGAAMSRSVRQDRNEIGLLVLVRAEVQQPSLASTKAAPVGPSASTAARQPAASSVRR
jgi:Flp pilus assembly secretin CpaC